MQAPSPRVSVLMPTFKHASFIRRALESLCAQTFTDWELIVVDDGSPDETGAILADFRADARIRYHRSERNTGLGAALNTATALARGQFIAYLPSDDVYYPQHLQRLIDLLDERPDVYVAYNGVRWHYSKWSATLHGDDAVGREAEALHNPPSLPRDARLTNDNLLALVQAMHRRDLQENVCWQIRAEIVTDRLETNFWRSLADHGAGFGYTGALTCEWVDHPDQHHKMIAAYLGGVARYRRHYGIERGEFLNFQPSRGMRVNERSRYGQFATARNLPALGGLKILLVGSLGFNPERILAFEERGHKLYGLWSSHLEIWDNAGPFAYGNIDDVPYDERWIERVRAVRPDVIYAGINWQALPFIRTVLDANLDIPFVFHFKEGPFITIDHGTFPTLLHVYQKSDGVIFINEASREWVQLATNHHFDLDRTFILDGDLPKIDRMTDDWQPKRSARDGEIHTVCPGRPLGLDPFEGIANAGIHVHFYGEHFQEWFPTWTRNGLASGYMHLHPAVEPGDWVRELSQYDAAWLHIFGSRNNGDLRAANWDDLNVPARLGTYAAAGLPWIMKDNRPAFVAMQHLAEQLDVGVFFRDFDDLAAQLRDRERMAQRTHNMRAARKQFAFDTHVDDLVAFFRAAIERRGRDKELMNS